MSAGLLEPAADPKEEAAARELVVAAATLDEVSLLDPFVLFNDGGVVTRSNAKHLPGVWPTSAT